MKRTNLDDRARACARVRAGASVDAVAASYGVRPATVRSWLTYTDHQVKIRERFEVRGLWRELRDLLDVAPDLTNADESPEHVLALCIMLEKEIATTRENVARYRSERGPVLPEGVVSLDAYRERQTRMAQSARRGKS